MADRTFNVILDSRPDELWPTIIEKTGFKQVLKFFRLLDDPEISNEEKFYYMLNIFFTRVPELEPKEIIKEVTDFISARDRKAEEQKEDEKEDKELVSAKKIFCWNYDHGKLFAAFWQAYHIDLRKVKLHWWTFKELFNNLPDNTRLMQIVELRGRKPNKKDSAESKRELAKAQASVAIPGNEGQDDLLDDFFDKMTRQK